MRKLAIFVEGQTELIFIADLLISIAGAHNVALHLERYFSKTYLPLRSDNHDGQEYLALIVDCGSDSSVATALRDRHAGLSAAGYELVLGIRDLFPIADNEYDRLSAAVASIMPKGGAKASMIIARREVEAWFVQEDTHYEKIASTITPQYILARTGFDVCNDCAETIDHPADFLHNAYQLGGRAYRKTKKHVQRTVIALDMSRVYTSLPAKLPSLKLLTDELETFFA